MNSKHDKVIQSHFMGFSAIRARAFPGASLKRADQHRPGYRCQLFASAYCRSEGTEYARPKFRKRLGSRQPTKLPCFLASKSCASLGVRERLEAGHELASIKLSPVWEPFSSEQRYLLSNCRLERFCG